MKTTKKSEYPEELKEKVKNTSDGELTDDDAQAAAGGVFPVFLDPDKKCKVEKPL